MENIARLSEKKIRISRMLNKKEKETACAKNTHVDVCPARKKKISHNSSHERFRSSQNIHPDNSDSAGCGPSCGDSLHFYYRAIIAYDPRQRLRYRARAREQPSRAEFVHNRSDCTKRRLVTTIGRPVSR